LKDVLIAIVKWNFILRVFHKGEQMTNKEKFKEVFGKELDESLKFDTSCSHISQVIALRSMYIKGVDNIVEWLNAEFVEMKGE
jgi:hypothetical protein